MYVKVFRENAFASSLVSVKLSLIVVRSASKALQRTLTCSPFGVFSWSMHAVMNSMWLFTLIRLQLVLLYACLSDKSVFLSGTVVVPSSRIASSGSSVSIGSVGGVSVRGGSAPEKNA